MLLPEESAEYVREREFDAFEKNFLEISLILENWDTRSTSPVVCTNYKSSKTYATVFERVYSFF